MAFNPLPQTIADLLPPVALDDVRAFAQAFFGVPQNKVTRQASGAVQRTIMELEAAIIADIAGEGLQEIAGGSYPGDAVGDWLTKLAHGWYAKDRAQSSVAFQQIVIQNNSGTNYTIFLNQALGVTTDGKTYTTASTGSVAAGGGQLTLLMQAQSPGAAHGMIAGFGLPGVVVIAAAIAVISTIPQFGSDGDSDTTVTAEIDARFPDLSIVPTLDRVVVWAQAAVPTITRYRLDPDTVVPGGVIATFANAAGGISGGDVTTVQGAYNDHDAITDFNTGQAAVNHTVDVDISASLVLCPTALLDQAKQQADASWTATLNSALIGGEVFLLSLIRAVMDAVGPTGNYLNPAMVAADGDGNIRLASNAVPITGVMPSALTWRGI